MTPRAPAPVAPAAAAATPPVPAEVMTELRSQGFSILRNAIPADILAHVDADLDDHFAGTPFGQGDFYGRSTKRFGRLLVRSPATRLLAADPAITAIAREVLAPRCDTIQLNVAQGIEVHPGEIAQVPHRDEDMWHGPKGQFEYLVNVMWPLTPFTPENGATRLWPGSHGGQGASAPPDETGEAAACEPGDAIVFLGSTLHGAGANRTDLPRRSLVMGYSLGWLKPYENLWLAYPPEIARDFGTELRSLVGYRQHRPNLGNLDGLCPSLLLDDRMPQYPAAIDALTPKQEAMVRAHAERERALEAAREP
ncbi:phytanoyl-CoA dioxygenase family protein [Novosphingobium sp. JCM 18896]|uniref:phytanoyl-CoA dioxygenase family protein n=1 Tax=Novosphingobium sp. JCM 18896 TaxID=2989731 RepID=UPI00222251D3|nr:phytanoyl-CoA dioxygenase family protein [Novosphingobium sp. JCM 18896]MCW1430890.1 phytanoyl-CoA dioxygenase family protein [Novosphingobium sp. JCM 18896]